MTNSKTLLLLGLSTLALLGACDRQPAAPSGQVIATVDGQDITIHELNAETSLAQAPPEVPRKTIEAEALQRIIERRVVADVARERKLDKSPTFILQERRAEDLLLAQALQADIASKVPKVTREAAQKYIDQHPDQFGERKVYTIDQIAFLRPPQTALLGLQAATTMPQVEAILKDAGIEYRRQPATLDTLRVDPRLAAEVAKILAKNPNEVFLFADQPRGAPAPIMFVNQVTETKVVPFTGEKAIEAAQQFLQRQAVQTKLQTDFKAFMDAEKGKITYAEGYGPPAKPKAPAAASAPVSSAGAPAPAPAASSTPAPASAAPGG